FRHEFPQLVLVQPDGVRIAHDEFIDGQAVNQWRTRDLLLLAIDEDSHQLFLSLASRSLFGGSSFAFGHWFAPVSQQAPQTFFHGGNYTPGLEHNEVARSTGCRTNAEGVHSKRSP